MSTPTSNSPASDWLDSSRGNMAALIRNHDWTHTPPGPLSLWPASLRTAVHIALGSRYPMLVWWGREFVNIYNDAYSIFLGARHPAALGRPAAQVWAEVWDIVGIQAQIVMDTGQATWNERLLLVLERNAFAEETYFTFSYSPVLDETGQVGGLFCACTEDTAAVLAERRLRTLRLLGERSLAEAKTVEQACHAAGTLGEDSYDFTFALVYLLSADGRLASLTENSNLAAGTAASPATCYLGNPDDVWNFQRALVTRESHVVENLAAQFGQLPAGAWANDWTRRALVLPLQKAGGQAERPAGFLVAGLSPRLEFNDAYRGFLELAAAQIATAIASARSYEEERSRAEALAEFDRAKTAFFSNVSHEFRTPLTLLLGPLQDALDEPASAVPAPQRERMEVAHRNAVRLLKLVNTLLDFSRIEAGRVDASYTPTDLGALTVDLASTFRSVLERAGLRLVVDCPPLPEPVYVDREMWEKIVLNLLSNAFKFTFEGEISVRLSRADGLVHLQVQDTGTGIGPDDLLQLFTRFHRIRGAQARTYEGTGIGLALVQELVKLHGGTIQVDSQLGQGTCFTVSLPTGMAHLPADRVEAGRSHQSTQLDAAPFVEEVSRWLPDDPKNAGDEDTTAALKAEGALQPAASSSVLGRPAAAEGSSARVLVVDDNADMRDYLRRLLGQQWSVITAADGATALGLARAKPPNLVLTDVMLPGLDGFQLLQALRADPATRTTPIVLLSARAGEESRIEGLAAGADDYLVKPFGALELMARVGAQLALARLRREATAQLQASEARFRALANMVPVIAWTAAPDGAITFANQRWFDYVGITPEQNARGWPQLVLHPDDYGPCVALWNQALRDGTDYQVEVRNRRHDGAYRWFLTRAVPVRDAEGRITEWFGTTTDIDERKRADVERIEYAHLLEEHVSQRTAELRRLTAYLQQVREEERKRIARELHDELGQQLTGVKIGAATLKPAAEDPAVIRAGLDRLMADIDGAIQSVRSIASQLRPGLLDHFGLLAAMDWQVEEFQRRTGIVCEFIADFDEVRLDDITGTALFRVLQETLTNVARHAQATQTEVLLEDHAGALVLQVRDNGRGITEAEAQANVSLGLLGMRERVQLLGGQLQITGEPGQGTTVTVTLPLLRAS